MRTLIADDEPPRPTATPRNWRPSRGSTTAGLTAAVIASLAGHGIEVTAWQADLIDWSLTTRERTAGPIVATVGAAFPPGAAVPGVIVAEYIDGR